MEVKGGSLGQTAFKNDVKCPRETSNWMEGSEKTFEHFNQTNQELYDVEMFNIFLLSMPYGRIC